MAEPIAELRHLTDEEIIRRHDAAAITTAVGVVAYRDELARRDAQRQGDRIEAMTRTVARLTWVIAACTGVVTLATLVLLYLAVAKG